MDIMDWIWKIGTVILGVVGSGYIYWFHKYISARESWEKKQDNMMEGYAKDGGLVTRNMHFTWCGQEQDKCPAIQGFRMISEWKETLADGGGPLLVKDHHQLCLEVSREMKESMEGAIKHIREVFRTEFQLIRSEILVAIKDLSAAIKSDRIQ